METAAITPQPPFSPTTNCGSRKTNYSASLTQHHLLAYLSDNQQQNYQSDCSLPRAAA